MLKKDYETQEIKWQPFIAGWGAGFLNTGVTFPLHKLIFRQMLYGLPASTAFHQLYNEGLKLLYRGLLPPLCQKTVTSAIMFGSYKSYGCLLMTSFPNIDNQVAKSCGAGLAGISEAVLTPFERIQTLLQDKHHNSKFTNSYHAVNHIWKNHGGLELYRGVSVIMLRNSLGNIVFFFSKEKAESIFPKSESVWAKIMLDFTCGGVIGGAISTMYYPLNVIKSKMQSKVGGPLEWPHHVFKAVLVERGGVLSEMYRGAHLNYTRSLLSWGITNASYELLMKYLQNNS